jgi:hypothetical protein
MKIHFSILFIIIISSCSTTLNNESTSSTMQLINNDNKLTCNSLNSDAREMLIKLVYTEARKDNTDEKIAVTLIVLNRVHSWAKSDDINNVIINIIMQKGQFSPTWSDAYIGWFEGETRSSPLYEFNIPTRDEKISKEIYNSYYEIVCNTIENYIYELNDKKLNNYCFFHQGNRHFGSPCGDFDNIENEKYVVDSNFKENEDNEYLKTKDNTFPDYPEYTTFYKCLSCDMNIKFDEYGNKLNSNFEATNTLPDRSSSANPTQTSESNFDNWKPATLSDRYITNYCGFPQDNKYSGNFIPRCTYFKETEEIIHYCCDGFSDINRKPKCNCP